MDKVQVNGIDLAYTRRGKGAPLVLVHGYPLDHSIWNEVAPLLEDRFDLILPDLRGFGESQSVETAYGIADIAADIAGLLDRLGLKQAALAGHSMGGYVSLAFARAYPTRLRGLALVASQALADSPERKAGRYKTAADIAEQGVGIVAEAMTTKLSAEPRVQNYVQAVIEKQTRHGLIGALKAMAERSDSTDLLASLNVPLALIHGEADVLIPFERAREIKDVVPAAQLFALKHAGHMPMMEFPRETAEALSRLA